MLIPTTKHEFGFLPNEFEGSFDGVIISVKPDFKETSEWVNTRTNIDGYFYPPLVATYEFDPDNEKTRKKVSNSEKPATVFHLPPSHFVVVNKPVSLNDPKVSDEALIIHALGFLFGTTLQFKEWRFVGRVPIKKNNSLLIRNDTAIHFIEHLYSWWTTLDPSLQTKVINIIYLHTKACSIKSEWESFSLQYMILDAIFNVYSHLHPPPPRRIGHAKRILFLCDYYGIAYEKNLVEEICKARNELFHEAMWADTILGMGRSNRRFGRCLGRLNEKLICSLSGYNNKFSKEAWHRMGWSSFDLFKS
ncbi:hypothetical protein GARC_3749 [Paraglaciecola arctica BSs20135]|uniref:Apea-like HEPN domain-containing protein n=2 Tax=Paraglaciecola TaxID=1621534 RepID=K6YVG2_9ALTE|nr:hypothetical protein GARC_3749 [Paraglaciecola arctica BSs20135]